MSAIPHPDKAAVDAAAVAFLHLACDMRKIPAEERPTFADLDPIAKITARNAALEILNPATPHIALAAARTLAADLDAVGHHGAATRINEVIAAWVPAIVPNDLSGLT